MGGNRRFLLKFRQFYNKIWVLNKRGFGKEGILVKKMNFKKLFNIFIFTLIALILIPINAYAKEGITLYINKNNLTIGDELVVTVGMPEDYDSYAFLATLKFDENVFQRIDDTNFTVDESESIAYNEANNKFGIINKDGKISGDLFSVRLKVKENASVGDTNIALTNISSSDGEDEETFSPVSTKVLVTRDAKDGETLPNNEENVIKEDEESPIKTFTTVPIIVTMALVAVVILGVIIYMLVNRKLGFNKKRFIALVVAEVLLIIGGGIMMVSKTMKMPKKSLDI